jgi:hypothetical protein
MYGVREPNRSAVTGNSIPIGIEAHLTRETHRGQRNDGETRLAVEMRPCPSRYCEIRCESVGWVVMLPA